MSLHEYRESQNIALTDPPFYALIMAAMRAADSANLAHLQQAFPVVWHELNYRYNAPGGILLSDPAESGPTPLQIAIYEIDNLADMDD